MTEIPLSLFYEQETGLMLDVSRMTWTKDDAEKMAPLWEKALGQMKALEEGAIANASENRQVGHYWLRNPDLAPSAAQQKEIRALWEKIHCFVQEKGAAFRHLLLLGIGGSALGPLFLAEALSYEQKPAMDYYLLDNTDPDGFDHVFAALGEDWANTLTVVVSKSGGTMETRNAMLETMARYTAAGVDFPSHAVAVTMLEGVLYQQAKTEHWLEIFPMWDWVGGRTSLWSAAGLLPLSLLGYDVEPLLAGAAACDRLTRNPSPKENPAMLLAGLWYRQRGKAMVLLPYKDRFSLLTKYMQQLIMESLGKQYARNGQEIRTGLTVFGNKGSTDQHSYMQQLLAGPGDFFAVFIEVLKDRCGKSLCVEGSATSGDYLQAYLLASAQALRSQGREVLILTIPAADAYHLGVLLALFERAVGLYAELLDINAYDQPAVEQGKQGAKALLALKEALLTQLRRTPGQGVSAETLAVALGNPSAKGDIFKLLLHMAVNEDNPVTMEEKTPISESLFAIKENGR